MNKLLITCVLFFVATAANCQDAYVNNSGDTIHGKITNYTQWSKSPTKVDFNDNSGNKITLTPLNCKSFMVDNSDFYISYSGTRIVNTDNIGNSASTGNKVMSTEHIDGFLRRIYQYKGFTLYKYSDSKRINFFLGKNDSLNELEYYEYIDDNSNALQTDDAYKYYILDQLKDVDAPDKQKEIDNLVYREDALINFFAKILNDKVNATEKKRNKYPSELYGGIGVDGKFGSLNHTDGSKLHQTGISPLFEIGMRIYGQRNFGKLFFQSLIALSFFDNTINDSKNSYILRNSGTLASVRIGPGYTFLKKQGISLYASAMVQLDFVSGYKSNYTYTGTIYTAELDNPSTMIKASLNPEVGLMINRSFNIALQGSLPYRLPVYYNPTYYYAQYTFYSLHSLGLVARYRFK